MKRRLTQIALTLAFLGCASIALAEPSLGGELQTQAPIPVSEQGLQTTTAQPWYKASQENHVLEGAIFDRQGNLLFCDVSARQVVRLTPEKKRTTVVSFKDMAPGGLALHRDGRLLVAALDLVKGIGTIVAVAADGSKQTILAPNAGYLPNDLVFDREGGFYFSDFKGTATEPTGGVYYVSPDFKTVTPVIPNLAMANGVALSPDGKTLWATEFGRNLLHKALLDNATKINVIGSSVPYHFIGSAPDSMRVGVDGNVYVAMYGQGRILILNRQGIPVGQALLPGRDKGDNLLSTSLAIHPNNKELYAVTGNDSGTAGSGVFKAQSFAGGLMR